MSDMHQSCRTAPPGAASPHLKGAAAEVGRPIPISDPSTSTKEGTNTTPCSPKKLHRKDRSTTASQPRPISNPFNFGIPKRTAPPAFTPSKSELAVVDVPGSKPERHRSVGATFSFLQPWHGSDRLGRRSSTSNTKSRASTGGSEDGEVVEPEWGSGPLLESKSTNSRNSKFQRRTIAQERSFPVYDWISLGIC